jgi:hypothetical protein
VSGAGDGIRTRDIQLGKLTLYQLSYSRKFIRFIGFFNLTFSVSGLMGLCLESYPDPSGEYSVKSYLDVEFNPKKFHDPSFQHLLFRTLRVRPLHEIGY